MEVLLGSFDGFMQNCDVQIDSFRAHLLEFLELQVSGIRDPPRHSRVCRASRSLREEGSDRGASHYFWNLGPPLLPRSSRSPIPATFHLVESPRPAFQLERQPLGAPSPPSFPYQLPGGPGATSAKVSDGDT